MWSLYTSGLYMQVQEHGKNTLGDLQTVVFISGSYTMLCTNSTFIVTYSGPLLHFNNPLFSQKNMLLNVRLSRKKDLYNTMEICSYCSVCRPTSSKVQHVVWEVSEISSKLDEVKVA